MSHDLLVYLAGSIAAFLVGLGKGGLSMAGAASVPILALVLPPVEAAALLLPVYVVSDVVGVWVYRHDFSAANLRVLLPSSALGIGLGWAMASRVSTDQVALLVGAIGIVFCLNSWRVRRRPPAPRPADPVRGSFWGTVLGFTSFVCHGGAPPFQVYVMPQHLPKLTYAGTAALTFAAVNALKIVPYAALGQFSAPNLRVAAVLSVPALAGTFAGVRLVRVLPAERYFLIVQGLLFVVSVRLVLHVLVG